MLLVQRPHQVHTHARARPQTNTPPPFIKQSTPTPKTKGAGLTVSVARDPVTGDTVFEAGAVVLGDRGLVALDELDKMAGEHQVMVVMDWCDGLEVIEWNERGL